jgi:hypothetical protein
MFVTFGDKKTMFVRRQQMANPTVRRACIELRAPASKLRRAVTSHVSIARQQTRRKHGRDILKALVLEHSV